MTEMSVERFFTRCDSDFTREAEQSWQRRKDRATEILRVREGRAFELKTLRRHAYDYREHQGLLAFVSELEGSGEVDVRCEFLVPVFWGLGTVVFRVVGTGPRGTSARAVSLSRLGWSGRWLYACRSLRYGFGGRC